MNFIELAITAALSLTTVSTDFAYRVSVDSDNAEVSVDQAASATTYQVQAFHCHSEFDGSGKLEGAMCHDEGTLAPVPHTLPAKLIDRSEFVSAIKSALSIFESRIGKIETVLELKVWQHGEDVTLRITSGDPATPAMSLFSCHLHGGSYDCHRTRKAGPNEPAN